MANTKPIYLAKKFRTGPGTARWPAVNQPDFKYKEEGEYSSDLIVPSGDPVIKRVEAAYNMAKAEWPNLVGAKGKKVADKPWDEEENGDIRIRIRRIATTRKGTRQRIKVIDNTGKPLAGEAAEFGNGSIIDVGFSARAWFTPTLGFGVSFMPDVVMLVEAKFEGGGSLDEYGFELDEGADNDELPPFDTDDEGTSATPGMEDW